MNKQTVNRYTLAIAALILLIIAAITAAAFLLPNIYRISTSPAVNNELVSLPKIDSVIYSSQDGSQHSLSVNFSLAVDENVKEKLDMDSIHAEITEIIAGLDYDLISEKGGFDYVKSEVVRGLESYISKDELKGLYISNLNSDNATFDLPYSNPAPTPTPSRKPTINEMLEGMGKRK